MLKALHVQDNDLKNDRHWLPYCGDLNWTNITRALGEIGYDGDLTFEIFGFLGKQEPDNLPIALKSAEQTGRLLIKNILKHRT